MVVKKVFVEGDGSDGRADESRWLAGPTWQQVEQSLLALDRDRRPFVWFYVDPEAAEDDVPAFEVVGGDGAYAMVGNEPDGSRLLYLDEQKGRELVAVWVSDQGAEVEARHVCEDVQTVLRATKLFCEEGAFDPRVTWSRE